MKTKTLKLNRKINTMGKQITTFVFALVMSLNLSAQTSFKKSIAVANPYVEGLNITPKSASKMIQLELIKLDKFSVYDEFDMAEVLNSDPKFQDNCYGINCLTEMGKKVNVDYVISGSFNGLGNRIAITLKWVDVNSGKIFKTVVREFDNQETEIQRMVKLLLYEMNGLEEDGILAETLRFKNEKIISNDVGKVNNSGPRLGYAVMTGDMLEFANRPQNQGGLDIFPGVSTIGYQFEGQYVGTENFSALIEGVFNITGLEQGLIIPSFSVLQGLRFGRAGWEFAFGPSFTLRKTSKGFFDNDNQFGKGNGAYFSDKDWYNYAQTNPVYLADSTNYNSWGAYEYPTIEEASDGSIGYTTNLDTRGDLKLSANWLMAFGRTFKAGSLNIPVNIFYSSSKSGGLAGLSVGFNVTQSKKSINGSGREL